MGRLKNLLRIIWKGWRLDLKCKQFDYKASMLYNPGKERLAPKSTINQYHSRIETEAQCSFNALMNGDDLRAQKPVWSLPQPFHQDIPSHAAHSLA